MKMARSVGDSSSGCSEPAVSTTPPPHLGGHLFRLRAFPRSTNTDPFAAWCVVTGDAKPDGIRVVRSLLGAINSLPMVAFREKQSCMAKRSRQSRVVERLWREAPTATIGKAGFRFRKVMNLVVGPYLCPWREVRENGEERRGLRANGFDHVCDRRLDC